MLLFITFLLVLPLGSFSANLPGAPWSKDEVAKTKERLWKIMHNPRRFVEKARGAAQLNFCNADCWEGCDYFKTTGPYDYCVHCDDIDCETCQCCRGWCDQPVRTFEPTAAKFVRLAFHQCLKYVVKVLRIHDFWLLPLGGAALYLNIILFCSVSIISIVCRSPF